MATISALTRQIADAVAEASADLECNPRDLTHAQLMVWLKEYRRLDAVEVKQIREHLQRIGGFQNLRNSFFGGVPSPAIVEREEMKKLAKLRTEAINLQALNELFLARYKEIVQKTFPRLAVLPVPQLGSRKRTSKVQPHEFTRTVTVMLSDLHFGALLDPREVPYAYTFVEEARALASVLLRVCDFKPDHREETELVIWLGGDIIQGKTKDKQAGAMMAEQVCDAEWLLFQFIRTCAAHYRKVRVMCKSGNHDRNESRHQDRAFDGAIDSHATPIYFSLKIALAYLPNVTVTIPRTPHVEWEAQGHWFYGNHGDTGFTVGNPSKTVAIEPIETQMKTINLARVARKLPMYSVFMAGHVHAALHVTLITADLIINPALTPVGPHAIGIGVPHSKFGQTLVETTRDYASGDVRRYWVDPEELHDTSLDKVVVPFKDF